MISGKVVSAERAIAIAYRDYGISRDIPHDDSMEWIGSALLELGVNMVLQETVETIEIESSRATLPCTVVDIIAVRDADTKMVYTYAGGSFHKKPGDYTTDEDPTLRYTANGNYIFTNREDGSIEVAYRSFMTDERGYPMIPEDEKVLRAVAAYIVYRLDYIDWRRERVSDKVYMDSQQKWLFAKASASTGMKIANMDHMEAMKAAWLRLIPNISAHETHFTFNGIQEQRRNFSY